MEGPTVPSDSRETQSAEGVALGRGAVAHLQFSIRGSVGYAPENFSKVNFEIACFLHCLTT